MKKNIAILFLAAAAALCSCEDLFTVKEVGEVNDEDMWMVPDMTRGLLFQSYNSMPSRPDTYNNNFLDVATDNAVTNSFDAAIHNVALGEMTAVSCPLSVWSNCYSQFQFINLFLEKALTSNTRYEVESSADKKTKSQLKAEALYLRAWWGAYLLQHHGGRTANGEALGYPIVTHYITEEEASDYSWIKRNTYEECVAQICSDCDEASAILPASASGEYIGRATSLMAEFLKARVLFYAACPAYQPSAIVRINGMGDFTIVDESAYKLKWARAAYQAAKVIELSGETSYTALKSIDIVDMDANNPVTPSHFVFRTFFKGNNLESRHFPPFYYGSALTAPSQNLVDAYPMKTNGFPITDPASGYDPQNPYSDRDNRLEFTVYHHGSKFGLNDSNIDVTPGGKDSEDFMSGSSYGSRSGYYLKKFLSSKKNMLYPTSSTSALHFFPSMRMAEMYFCLAEASNEVWGPTEKGEDINCSAYDIIKDVRSKAGGILDDQYIETVKNSKDSFRNLILNERRLEFAFENFRFWDLRRCLLPLDETVRAAVVTKDASDNVSYATKEIEKRNMTSLRHYYLPVPYTEMLKNPDRMINNIGY